MSQPRVAPMPIECQAMATGTASIDLPPWWRASPDRFAKLFDMRRQIHAHEQRSARAARSAGAGALFTAVSVYSVDATGAMGMGAAPAIFAFLMALALPIVVAWLLDRRLAQQLCDVELRSRLWLDLVEGIRRGRIDATRLNVEPAAEGEIQYLLRREAATAARFLASHERLSPHLPIFGQCFTLESR